MSDARPVACTDDGVTVAIRVTPKAGRNRIDGMTMDAKGRPMVRIAVTAAPEDGKANKALIALLARIWRIPKSTISVQSGHTSRNKVMRIVGDTTALKRKIEETLSTLHNA